VKISEFKSNATLRSSNAISLRSTRKGIALVTVAIVSLILIILGFSMLNMVNDEITLARNAVNKTKAFYLAEAGVEIFTTRLNKGKFGNVEEIALGEGSYHVDFYPDEDPAYAIATGTVAGQQKRIKVTASFLAAPYECGIYAGGLSGEQWTLLLRGKGNPVSKSGGEVGGKDIVSGNVFVDGDVALHEESSVNSAPPPNTFGLNGDVEATGSVELYDSASVSGDINEGVAPQDPPDLVGMNYAVNNTHNVSQIFTDNGISKGTLPAGHPLRDIFVKNPTDRSSECDTTTGDDYFIEPISVPGGGNYKDSTTPLHLGNDRVYYVDGDVWIHNKVTYGFKMDGKVTIVATGDIHISDNLEYTDSNSMLGLVALGKYNGSDNLVSGGNVYFGDPRYGTMYTFSAMMFAANDFIYNTDTVTGKAGEPTSGFTVNGCFAALNKVSVERDWYTKDGKARPARFNSETGQWIDSETGQVLTESEISTLQHYQMKLNYDDRVRTKDTQPPGLPRGKGVIFDKLTNWRELP